MLKASSTQLTSSEDIDIQMFALFTLPFLSDDWQPATHQARVLQF